MKKLLTLVVAGLLGVGALPQLVHAETMNYTIKAEIPENQIDKAKTYFDLRMTPAQEEVINLTVSNTSNEELKLKVEPNTAVTNQNGVVDYSQKGAKKDSTLKYAFSDLIKGETDITLAPNETKELPYTIKMPAEKFDGIILGGFYVSKVNSEKEEAASKNVQIKNHYSYVVGAKLSETDTVVKPNLKLNDVKPALQNYRTGITANLQNTEATMMSELKVTTSVTKKGSQEVLHKTEKESMSMAPNSNFDFPISWDNQPLKAGKYELTVVANDKDQSWKFTKEFEIKGEESAKLNKEAVEVEKDSTWIYYLIAGLVAALIALLLIIIVAKRKKGGNKDEEEKD
ncbi:DUF916 and DUF3324 domain-containing protein [Carnobacterium gallinarum]|uniref:DUF916 and DUF3324 domain-containing protein n=1 Tax=Carnobacterium gallinarum TaxID=2749 RepID=UPI000A946155|nr:DUF916 and DUF3324 domain-containing protein [Carnobacterium gallinarum]